MRILITGLSGFIGHHIAEHFLKTTDCEIVGLDRYGISGTQHRLLDIENWNEYKHRVSFVWHDLRSPINDFLQAKLGDVNYILHLAASTHVDRSIIDPMSFVLDNVVGTCNLLDYARKLPNLKRFLYFSTDEVFGPAPKGTAYKEWDRYNSGNPYAAAKAGGEELALAYHNTYGLPVLITHTMNVFGERQHREKFIPSTIRKVLNRETVTVHGNKEKTASGSRFYIHAGIVADALGFVLKQGKVGDKYNIVGEEEVSNLQLARFIASELGEPLDYELVDFHSSRPGHDLRYALDGTKLQKMGFRFPCTFRQSLKQVINWTVDHPEWLA